MIEIPSFNQRSVYFIHILKALWYNNPGIGLDT
jgi:hypothetical protein